MDATAPCRTYTIKGQTVTIHFGDCPACKAKAEVASRRAGSSHNHGNCELCDELERTQDAALARAVEGAKAEGYSRGYQEGLTRGAAEAVEDVKKDRDRILMESHATVARAVEAERERIIAFMGDGLSEWHRAALRAPANGSSR
jgi:hypothetical protein